MIDYTTRLFDIQSLKNCELIRIIKKNETHFCNLWSTTSVINGQTFCKRLGFQTYNYKPKLSSSKWISREKHTNYYTKTLTKAYESKQDPNLDLLSLRTTHLKDRLPPPAQRMMKRIIRTNLPYIKYNKYLKKQMNYNKKKMENHQC